jgi:hypothetical protein
MKKIIILLLTIASLAACKKDKTTETPAPIVYLEENPMPEFLATTGFDQYSTVSSNLNSYEEGFTFKASVKGMIPALVIKLPVVNSSLRITIWDSTSHAVLRTENINIPVANTETLLPIPFFNI